MAQYALVNGELAPVAKLGQRALCWDHKCRWEMVARPGNGKVLPHWAHKPGSAHTYSSDTEKGEWHREVQYLFESRGATTEVPMRSADGERDHIADVVCGDGRIIEAQTRYLAADDIISREATYGDMCWLYDAHDTGKWFITDNPNDPATFRWGKPDRAFMLHSKPIYFDTGDGVWILEQMFARHRKGNRGYVIYEGRRRKVAADLLQFVDMVSAGATFGARARMTLIDPRKNNRGVKFRTLMDIDEWADRNATCTYETFVIDEEAERVAQAAEAARLAEMIARYEAEQARIARLQQEANQRAREAEERRQAMRAQYEAGADERREAERARLQAEAEEVARVHARQLVDQRNTEERSDRARRQTDLGATDWSRLAGLVCTCPSGCTDAHWGDAGVCSAECRPCRIMAGVTYTSPRSSRKSAE